MLTVLRRRQTIDPGAAPDPRQSDDGERFIERALSVSVTCRLQCTSMFTYMRELLTANARGDPLPTHA